jgi:hypothetical protein
MAAPASLESQLPLAPLAEKNILFIRGENRESMAPLTEALYERLRPQKEMISLASARVRMMNAEKLEAYDRQVVNFFNLSLSRSVSRSKSNSVRTADDSSGIWDPAVPLKTGDSKR